MRLLLIAVIFLGGLILLYFLRKTDAPLPLIQQGGKQTSQSLLLPDLKLSPPEQLYIESTKDGRFIRFNTTFINQGKGPLEVVGQFNQESQKTRARQKIYKIDGTIQEEELGEFIFHPGHEHWHIEKYALFELWGIKENGDPDKLIATTEKMSFCLWDEKSYDLTLENASQIQRYTGCNNETQGVSVGWSDTYEATIEGQVLDIRSLPDGHYLVRSIINPDKKIQESEYSNNEVKLPIKISGDTMSVEK